MTPKDPGNSSDSDDRTFFKRCLQVGAAIVAVLVAAAGISQLVPVLFDDTPKKATATTIGADAPITTRESSDEVSGQIIRIAQRQAGQQFVQGRFVEFRLLANKSLVSSKDHPQQAPGGRVIPPHVELPTTQCPQNPGVMTTLRVYLYGDIGANNIGYRGSSVAVAGLYSLADLQTPDERSRSTYCWVDATETEPG